MITPKGPVQRQEIGCAIPGCGCLFWALAIVGLLYLLGVLT